MCVCVCVAAQQIKRDEAYITQFKHCERKILCVRRKKPSLLFCCVFDVSELCLCCQCTLCWSVFSQMIGQLG